MKLLVVSPSPVTQYEETGNLEIFTNYHNPNETFDEVHVLQPPTAEGGTFEIGSDIVVHRTRFPNPGGLLGTLCTVIGLLLVIARGIAVIRRKRIHLIRGQGQVPGGLIGLVLKVVTGVPNATSIHTDFDKARRTTGSHEIFGRPLLTEAVERLIIRRSTAILTLTPFLREIMIRHGAAESDVYVLPNHIKLERFSSSSRDEVERKRDALDIDEDTFTLLFVGRLVDEKDPMTLLSGFAAAATDADVGLVVIGDGPYREEMAAFVSEHDLEDDVQFTGFVERDEVSVTMAACDALVHPALFEGFGFVYIEAQAAGLPIITTDIPHVKSVVNAENGFVFPPRDAEALAERIIDAQNAERRAELVRRGRETVQRFSTERQHDHHETVLRSLAESGTKEGGKYA